MNNIKQVCFDGYAGSQIYRVSHPIYGLIDVFAPSRIAAICASAKEWDEDWQDNDFFFSCEVSYLQKPGRRDSK